MPTPEEKLINARCRLMSRQPFYGHMALGMEWMPSDRVPTMGVRIVDGGRVQCLYNTKFVDSLPLEQIFAVCMHEIEHIVRLHCVRVEERHPSVWNLAADMCVNGTKDSPRIGYRDETKRRMIMPFDGTDTSCVYIPKGWETDSASETYYDKLLAEAKLLKKKAQCTCGDKGKKGKKGKNGSDSGDGEGKDKSNQGKGQGQGQNGTEPGDGDGDGDGGNQCPVHGNKGGDQYAMVFGDSYGTVIDDHSLWNETDISPEEARQIVHEMVKDSAEKSQGDIPGHLKQAIEALAQPILRWREILRRFTGSHLGNRKTTFARQSRRRPVFGNPGISHHNCAKMDVIVDTSGSISNDDLQQFFAEIDAMSIRAKVRILQWDHAYQGYNPRYRRGDWKKIEVNGRGGTDMAAPVEWLINNKCVGDVVVMLTDGYCNYTSPKPFPLITCITVESPHVAVPTWGQTVFMKPDRKAG